jgi:hypothetical protein
MGEKGLSKYGLEVIFHGVNAELRHAGFEHSGEALKAFNSTTGQNAAWDNERGQWIDVKTGAGLTAPIYK